MHQVPSVFRPVAPSGVKTAHFVFGRVAVAGASGSMRAGTVAVVAAGAVVVVAASSSRRRAAEAVGNVDILALTSGSNSSASNCAVNEVVVGRGCSDFGGDVERQFLWHFLEEYIFSHIVDRGILRELENVCS